ncbi:MAG: hypothetical protein AAGG75_08295 [Bacteroidota bacterium]
MKIEFSEEQYRTLLQVLYWGECVSNSYKSEIDEQGQQVAALEQYLFSKAKEFGAEDWIAFEEEKKLFYPTQAMQEATHPKVIEFEETILARDKLN